MKLNKDSIKAAEIESLDTDLNPSKAELELRKKVAMEDKYNLFETAKPKVDLVLFPPVQGPITQKYNAREKHFAVDIALPKNTPIKSVANGTVIFADWTPTNGNVIILRHNNEFLSVYKHCESLTISQGEVVKTSEVIAIGGTSGEQSTGIHLHFELWKDGYPIDPTQFIDFD
jgi:murein DD-endopeptidase MepM/ murein hydrolase activator NlpD